MAKNDKGGRHPTTSRSWSGPADDFEQLFKRFYRPVSYFFANRGFSSEECRDLTQETFLGVYKGIGRFRRDASVETWLFTIAGNIWRNELRSRSADKRAATEVSLAAMVDEGARLSQASAPIVGPKFSGPLDDTLAGERTRMLRDAMAKLPAQMRRCVLLRVEQDMKYREIATVMQVSIETVKSQLYQARERLKISLGSHFTDDTL